jgi:hypothetical protein
MQTTSHSAVLQALSLRATYVNGKKNTNAPLHAWTIDESGTLDTLVLDTSIESEIVEKEIWELSSIAIPEEALRIHGFAPPKKAEGIVRLIYENVNGIKNQLSNNNKVEQMQAIHDDLEVNLASYCKHKLNMKHKRNVNGFNQFLKEASLQFSPSRCTMFMRTWDEYNREVPASFYLVISLSNSTIIKVGKTQWALDGGWL